MDFGKKEYLLIIAVVFLGGLFLQIQEIDKTDNQELNSSEAYEFCGPHEIIEQERYINRVGYSRNITWKSYPNEKVPDWKFFINRHNVRNEPFPLEKPENEYRVAVFGASRSAGYGVNQSDTYSYILQENLNESTSKNVRVINAHHGRYGMKDRYTYILNDGLEFEPDLVLIPFTQIAEISHKENDRIQKQVKEDFNLSEDAELRNYPKVFDNMSSRYRSLMQSKQTGHWRNSHIRKYGNLISLLGEKKDFEVVFYWLDPDFDRINGLYSEIEIGNGTYESPIIAMEEVCGREIVISPEELQENTAKYRYNPEIYPYNPKGHQFIAQHLTKLLKSEVE
jgi:hypothetical protein